MAENILGNVIGAAALAVGLFTASASHAQPLIELATPEQAAAAISERDAYLDAVTAGDMSIWLRRPQGGADMTAFTAHLAANVRPWTAAERVRLAAMIERVSPRLRSLAPLLPARVQIAGFNGSASGDADFTRGSTIFLAHLKPTDDGLDERFFHELFHVLSRANPDRRDAFYGIVGFERCSPVVLDNALRARVVTNPDAPTIEYASPVSISGQNLLTTPVLAADLPRYTAQSGLFDHVQLLFVPLSRDAQGRCTQLSGVHVSQAELGGAVIARAGGNTDYVIHPEELVADNFAQMMMGRRDAPGPEIYGRLATLLNIERPSTRE